MLPEDFCKRIKALAVQFPLEQETALRKGANKLRKEIRNNTPDSGVQHKSKLNKSWQIRLTGFTAKTIQAEIYSKAPHFHLVERGHVIKTPGGKVKGFKQGKFFLKKTVDANKKQITDDMAAAFYRLVKDKING